MSELHHESAENFEEMEPTKTEKEKRWKEIERKFESDEDVDEKILPVVVALNAMGIETIHSCQGHLTDFKPSPHVDLLTSKSNLLTSMDEAAAKVAEEKLIEKIMDNLVLCNGVEDYTSVENMTDKQLEAYQNEFKEFRNF